MNCDINVGYRLDAAGYKLFVNYSKFPVNGFEKLLLDTYWDPGSNNDLTKKEKMDIGDLLLRAIHYTPLNERGSVFRRKMGNYKSGFYGPRCLPWYAGLVFYKTGIDDSLSISLLGQGCDDYFALLQ